MNAIRLRFLYPGGLPWMDPESEEEMRSKMRFALIVAGLICLASAGVALALVPEPQISWDVMAGGGGVSSNGAGVELMDTLGQPVVGVSGGGEAQAHAGYWYLLGVRYGIFLPIVSR